MPTYLLLPHLLLPTFAYFCLLLLHQARAALAAESLDEATDLAKQAYFSKSNHSKYDHSKYSLDEATDLAKQA